MRTTADDGRQVGTYTRRTRPYSSVSRVSCSVRSEDDSPTVHTGSIVEMGFFPDCVMCMIEHTLSSLRVCDLEM